MNNKIKSFMLTSVKHYLVACNGGGGMVVEVATQLFSSSVASLQFIQPYELRV